VSQAAANIPSRERLIIALDVPDTSSALKLVRELGESVAFYKIGLELAMTRDYFDLLDQLLSMQKRVFADLKLYDIPATVASAVRQLQNCGASFLTVHGEAAIMQAAAENKGDELKILAVTVLTSIGQQDLDAMGIAVPVETLTLQRAQAALNAGCDGVIASGLEAGAVRETLGPSALIVTPGIRPASGQGHDDQKRVVTPADAIRAGADHIVVGRPVRAAADPRGAAEAIQAEIASAIG
jgi:orotidine-5'-phosphate decarboxylase